MGWMVADAGPAKAIISTMTKATVNIKVVRLINANLLLDSAAAGCTTGSPRLIEYPSLPIGTWF
jgi:hypothetical protein